MSRQCSRASVVKVYINHKSLRAGLLLGSYWDLLKQSLMVDLKGI